ncbi:MULTISPECIES: OmpA family protein [unclassified Variovorax]|uniref:OmpA family protein n=1 Tax=unclassified Variovorax TaxID=663243 RepID=UPI00076C3D87|nr:MULTISPECIES: OmpA family protein [unclassified Variovorax]KWT72310.1 Outer membrane protein A precursor [Variovorax sp. WDL1]PNG53257.1 Photosystem I P700 chlorophyll a apoprotein A2 [Variovorax sp. B2]PNG53829.1 Photosystem I P700 chlorophyll a apoprotein A2 [Variovorax sp. B4]VTV11288.1 Photosystem I P700 chlorophyll a apoprotein A2 [Variovorax sp. WDL1]
MVQRRPVVLAAALSAALLAACAAPSATRVILLPQTDGTSSAVVVRANSDDERTLSQPYQRATVKARGAPAIDQIDPARLQTEHKALFEMMPGPVLNYTVYFDIGGSVLTGSSQAAMNDALKAALARSGGEIVVTGHTDTLGSSARNDELSRRRAEQIRQLFLAQGFPAQRIDVAGRGERDLAIPTADEVEEPRNRRVAIEVR